MKKLVVSRKDAEEVSNELAQNSMQNLAAALEVLASLEMCADGREDLPAQELEDLTVDSQDSSRARAIRRDTVTALSDLQHAF